MKLQVVANWLVVASLTAGVGAILFPSSLARAEVPSQEQVAPGEFDLEKELKKPKFDFEREKSGTQRRDPLENPLTKIVTGRGVAPSVLLTEAGQKKLLDEAETLFTEIQSAIAIQDWKQAVLKHRRLHEILDMSFSYGFQEKVGSLKSRDETLSIQIIEAEKQSLYEEALKILSGMNSSFHEGRYSDVDRGAEDLARLFPEGKVPEGIPLGHAFLQQGEHLVHRSTVRKKLESIPFAISGILWTPAAQTAIVNNQEVEPGDILTEGVRVKEITAGAVIFQLEAETYAKGLTEEGGATVEPSGSSGPPQNY